MAKGKRNGAAGALLLDDSMAVEAWRATGLAGLGLAHNRRLWNDLENMVLPPLAAGQFRVWRRGTTPVACAAWAFLGEAAEARLLGERLLAPGEWRGGDRLWLVYLLAPYGGVKRFAGELRRSVFAGRDVWVPVWDPGGVARAEVWEALGRGGGKAERQPVRPPGRLVDSFQHP